MRRLLLSLVTALALLAVPAAARAAFFTEAVDGPDAGIDSLGGVDVARDGQGGLVYVEDAGGVPHVFASILTGGAFQAPQQLDAGLPAPSSDPSIAASDGGRLVAVWVEGGDLLAAVKPEGSATFGPPQLVYDDPANAVAFPMVDTSVNGVSWVVWDSPGGSAQDVHAARLRGTTWQVLPGSLDIMTSDDAGGTAATAPRVSVAADGIAQVTWGEAGNVFARKVFRQSMSLAPQNLGAGDSPSVGLEEDSSYGWVAFRQGQQIVARRQVGDEFMPPVPLGGDASAPGAQPAVVLDQNGHGIALAAHGSQVWGALIDGAQIQPPQRLDTSPSTIAPYPVGAFAAHRNGVVAWQGGDPGNDQLFARQIDHGAISAAGVASDSAFGTIDGELGTAAAADRVGDAVVAYLAGPPDQRRVVVTLYDRPPGKPYAHVRRGPQQGRTLSWGPSFDLWGEPTYQVYVDQQLVATTTDTQLTLPQLAEGDHTWQVVATDRRGQTRAIHVRPLRIDDTAPQLAVRISRHPRAGRPVRFHAVAQDVSGLRDLRIYPDRAGAPDEVVEARKQSSLRAEHVYARNGHYDVLVTARDRAGNLTKLRERLHVRRARHGARRRQRGR